MTLGEKVRYLREVEGALRGFGRAMNQSEVVREIRNELGSTITQAYLSQVENGRRKHLTDTTRMLLARFFKVHPGYLVNDPEGFHPELQSAIRATEDSLDLWLIHGAERFSGDTPVMQALLAMARHSDSRKCILLMHRILDEPGLADRLLEALTREPAHPTDAAAPARFTLSIRNDASRLTQPQPVRNAQAVRRQRLGNSALVRPSSEIAPTAAQPAPALAATRGQRSRTRNTSSASPAVGRSPSAPHATPPAHDAATARGSMPGSRKPATPNRQATKPARAAAEAPAQQPARRPGSALSQRRDR